jgi:hypothetical protein
MGKGRSITIEKCPHINEDGKVCGLRGYLREETPRFYRVMHRIYAYDPDGERVGYGSRNKPKELWHKPTKSKRVYHNVDAEWARQQFADKEK